MNPVTGVVTFTPVLDFSGTTTPVPYSVCDNGTPLPAQCAQATITVTVVFDPIAKLQLKVMLQGALIGTDKERIIGLQHQIFHSSSRINRNIKLSK